MKSTLSLVASLLLCVGFCNCPDTLAKKVKLTHTLPSRTSVSAGKRGYEIPLLRKTQQPDSATFMAMRDSIAFSGYDKTTQATKETFLVTN
ncbi:MAG: hypothetical protein K2F87_02535, partial [Muribaculaceae bacterium]|nr:hypothetical protein [Muribaculaceae bacterium]